ncbi:unnamed protein product [Pieris macdunnoughi]|uniref:C2 domain-containing protein n=1 Tax=Pieris macdunnoughi TaxID=345717 RepID=A0A821U1W2_9NEOP|nr:unnamed protein product [Pieris macdunnoughi]
MDTASETAVTFRNNSNSIKRWRPSSLMNIVIKNNKPESVLQSIDVDKEMNEKKISRSKSLNSGWTTAVAVVLIEAKNVSHLLQDDMTKGLFCKLRLGIESYKSKSSSNSIHPEWRERFKMHLYHDNILHVSLWDRGNPKISIGSCAVDLAKYQKERTHDLWLELGESPAKVHLSITMCAVRAVVSDECICNFNKYNETYSISNLDTNLNDVGVLHVKVIGARGLGSKPRAYCTLQVDNQKVQTHRAGTTSEIVWNRCYLFNISDVSSTLDLKVYESSIANTLLNESIGKVSIPLLRVANNEKRWYALKDRNKRNSARGDHPRVLLQMSLKYHPVKASLKLFQAKEEQHVKKGMKFDIGLLYSNVVFVSHVFQALQQINEFYKRLFEWDDREFSLFVLIGWIIFCYFIQIWMIPLSLLMPFLWHWIWNRHQDNVLVARESFNEDDLDMNNNIKDESDKGLMSRVKINEIPQVTITVTKGIEMIASYAERAQNLVSFKVPFISYVAICLLLGATFGLYLIPYRYIMMAFGVMKFTRKYLYPNRVLNNDLLYFFSRIPDDAILKDWKELHIPKPQEDNSRYQARSVSTSI